MIIRKAIPGDEREIARVHVAGWQFSYRGIYSDEYLASMSVQEKIDTWGPRIKTALDENSIFVAMDGKQLQGFISVCRYRGTIGASDDGEVSALYIDPNEQGKGVGSALLSHVLSWYKSRGIKNIFVQTLDKSTYKDFYPKNGGVLQPEKTERTFKDGQTLELVEYKWEL